MFQVLAVPLHHHLFKEDTTSNLLNISCRTGEILQFDGQQLPYIEISETCFSTSVSDPPQLTSWCEPRYLFCSAIPEIIRESATPSTQTITSNSVVAGPGHESKSSILNLLKGLGHEIELKHFDKKLNYRKTWKNGPKKVEISGPTPSNGPRTGFPIQIHTSSPM